MNVNYRFPKANRLKSKKQIGALFNDGQSLQIEGLRLIYHLQQRGFNDSSEKVAFAVSKKHFKKAVDRNFVKRRLREAYRLHHKSLLSSPVSSEQTLSLMFIYTAKELPTYATICDKIKLSLSRLNSLLSQQSP